MNWKKIIKDLNAAGFSQVQIAKSIGVSQPTIHRLTVGVQPMWPTATRLINFHREVCPEKTWLDDTVRKQLGMAA